MNKLTPKEISRVFAMYIGCDVIDPANEAARLVGVVDEDAHVIHEGTGSYGSGNASHFTLLLRPLSDITDEHAVEIARMAGWASDADRQNHNIVVRVNKDGFKVVYFDLINDRNKAVIIRPDRVFFDFNQSQLSQLTLWNYAVPLWFGINHWANGKTAIVLNIAKATPTT